LLTVKQRLPTLKDLTGAAGAPVEVPERIEIAAQAEEAEPTRPRSTAKKEAKKAAVRKPGAVKVRGKV
jgi:hypothetical protein